MRKLVQPEADVRKLVQPKADVRKLVHPEAVPPPALLQDARQLAQPDAAPPLNTHDSPPLNAQSVSPPPGFKPIVPLKDADQLVQPDAVLPLVPRKDARRSRRCNWRSMKNLKPDAPLNAIELLARKADIPSMSSELNALTEAELLETAQLMDKPALFVSPIVSRGLDPNADLYKPDFSGELAAMRCSMSWMANRVNELTSRLSALDHDAQCGRPRHRRPSRSSVAKKHARQVQRLENAIAALKSR